MFLDFDDIPRFESERITPEKIEDIRTAFLNESKTLDKRLGREATFQDLIVDKTYKTDTKEVKRLFNGYIYAWNLIGRTTENAKEVYFQHIVEFEQGYTSNESKLAWNDAVIKDASNSFTEVEITRVGDKKPIQDWVECDNCGIEFYTQHPFTICETCRSKSFTKKKFEVKEDKSTKDKSFSTFLYVAIGLGLLVFLYQAGTKVFLIGGAIILFALIYIGDKEGWTK
ncbi:MAG: hypothetical protein R2797_00130 [Gelidibacter sp.]